MGKKVRKSRKQRRITKVYVTVKEKANEPLCVWHLLVSLMVMAWLMNLQFTTAMRQINEIRDDVYEQQKTQTETIVHGLGVLKELARER